MSNRINIDDLLKQELTNLQADTPPDVWQNLDSKLNSTPRVQQPSSDVVSSSFAGKTALFGVKTVIFLTAAVVITVVTYQLANKPEVAVVNKPISQSQVNVSEKQEVKSNLEDAVSSTEITANSGANKPNGGEVKNTKRVAGSKQNIVKETDKPKFGSNEFAGSNTVTENQYQQVKINQPTKTGANDIKQPLSSQKEVADVDDTKDQPIREEENYIKPDVPNVFTPNGDGINDQFVITIEQDFIYELKITNLKGEVVFETKDKNKHWDGIHQFTGAACESGVYVLAFRYQVLGMKEAKVLNSKLIIKQ